MQPIKILLLEDRPDDAELILLELKRGGFDPHWQRVDSETDFRKHLDPSINVILADFAVPQFGAMAALEILNESGLDIPLIVVSGSIGEDLAVATIKAGGFDYVIKDRLARLPQAVRLALAQHSLRNDKHKAEEAQLILENQLRQAQKMEAIGQLAGGIAHDFNNILQIILGNIDFVQKKQIDAGLETQEVQEILSATNRAADLTRRLLAFSRRQVLQSQDVDLNELLVNLLKMLTRLIGENIHVDFIPHQDLGVVYVDPGQIEQVLMNLMINARDAMPEGGTITVQTHNVTIDGEYNRTHPWVKLGHYAQMIVTDTGCGIDKEIQNHIFEPFFTTKDKDKGTGLGLAMVYGIVKQHEGFIHLYSEPGHGTTFKIYLPIVERQANAVGHKLAGPIIGGSETILIAEDEASVRELTSRVLTRAGYTCHTAVDGVEAIQVFEKYHDSIDFVLLDAIMPRMNGRLVFERIKALRPELPVLFCSGYSMNVVPETMLADRGVELIQKPYAPSGLLRKIREMLDAK